MLMGNYAFIDGQNLHLWLWVDWRDVDLFRLKRHLEDKYNVSKAFYYIWYYDEKNSNLYSSLEYAWFIVKFKKQRADLTSSKKWNIDTDLIFEVMRLMCKEKETFDKILLITWDWDFKILVDFLIEEWKFEKIIFPCKQRASSMYRKLPNMNKDYLINFKSKIEKASDMDDNSWMEDLQWNIQFS